MDVRKYIPAVLDNLIWFLLVAVIILFSFLSPEYLSPQNFLNILFAAAVLGLVAPRCAYRGQVAFLPATGARVSRLLYERRTKIPMRDALRGESPCLSERTRASCARQAGKVPMGREIETEVQPSGMQ